VAKFFSKLMGLWNEFGNYVKYSNCTCEVAEKFAKMDEHDKVHQFLIGLEDDGYSNLLSQILALDPLPSLDKIFSMVQQGENHKTVMNREDHRHANVTTFTISHVTRGAGYGGDRVSYKH